MTVWLARLRWRVQGYRNVRLQLVNNAGAIDGILVGTYKGHYRLRNAYYYAQVHNAQGEEMIGETWIPKDRVFLLNVKD